MSELDDDRDEEWFKEVYGTEYTGPPRAAGATKRGPEPTPPKVAVKRAPNPSDSEEEDEPRDPNAVPTDFTSREAKVWEAKAKAVERNWKRRKEEELTCRLCGEVGHFAQVSDIKEKIPCFKEIRYFDVRFPSSYPLLWPVQIFCTGDYVFSST